MSFNDVPLGDLISKKGDFVDGPFGSNLKASEYVEIGVPIIQLKNIKPNKYLPKDLKFVTEEKASELSRHSYSSGDVVIAKLGAVGTACRIPTNAPDGIVVADVCRFRGDLERIDYDYLCFFLNSLEGQKRVLEYSKGTTRLRTNLSELKKVKIPLPPLETQKQIAAVLEKADQLRKDCQQMEQELNSLAQSVFIDMFGDPVKNPRAYNTEKFKDLGLLARGKSKHRPRNDPALLDGAYPLIQTGDVARAGDYIKSYSSTYSELGLKQSKLWPRGTLCITIAANIADTAILDFDACFPDSVVGFPAR